MKLNVQHKSLLVRLSDQGLVVLFTEVSVKINQKEKYHPTTLT